MGGAGFIGSHLVERLLEGASKVRVLDDGSTGSFSNLEGLGDVDVRIGDIREPEQVVSAAEGCEVVFHLAALPSVTRSVKDPMATHHSNVNGTLNVLMAARKTGVRRVIFSSSSSVYGDTPTLPKHEEMPQSPMSPYAASKLAGEAYCRAFFHAYGLETVSLRFFNIFGPRQSASSEYAGVIARFVERSLAGTTLEIFGDGKQSRDFTYVANAVEACLLAGQSGPESLGQTINVGCGGRITLLELVTILEDLLGKQLEVVQGPPRIGEVRDSQASIEKARRLLGYEPVVSVKEGLSRTLAYSRNQRDRR